jgi:hypothetical protein
MEGGVPFKLDSVQIDNSPHASELDIELGAIKSGESKRIQMNFTTVNSQDGYLNNLNFTCAAGDHLPDSYSVRKFYIRKQVHTSDYLVSELDDVYQLYYFQVGRSKLISLDPVFFTQVSFWDNRIAYLSRNPPSNSTTPATPA